MKYLLLFLLVGCATAPQPGRLPEPSGTITNPIQWEEYCDRQEWEDVTCQEP